MVRYPTDEEYLSYDGGHCSSLWGSLGESWRCPGCQRSKREILSWKPGRTSMRVRLAPAWRTALHGHHDHQTHIGLDARFPETVVCGACNAADGYVKVKLCLPVWFSYSPMEMSSFVTGRPHQGHLIDLAEAKMVWNVIGGDLVRQVEEVFVFDHANRDYASRAPIYPSEQSEDT